MVRYSTRRHLSRKIAIHIKKKPSLESEEKFNAFMGLIYESTGAQRVTGSVVLGSGGYIGVADANDPEFQIVWILDEPGNPRNLKDLDVVTAYGIKCSDGNICKTADVFKHKSRSKIYKEVMAL